MERGETEKFSLPEVADPFVTVLRVASAEALLDRNRPHYHPDTVEMCAVVRGQLDWFVEDESFVVRPGEVMVVPPNVVHGAVDSNLQPCEIVSVHFAPERLPPKLGAALLDLSALRVRQALVGARIVEILEVHRQPGPFFAEVAQALGILLVASVVEAEPDPEETEKGRLIRLAQKALMGGHGNRPTIDDVAKRLGVSAVWLHKLFVRETGASPGDWARAKRLSEAKRRLAQGQESAVAIAMDLGYSSGQAFATAFRKESGMTPSEYRASHSADEAPPSGPVYRVDMRETWIDDVRVYPPDEPVRNS